MQMPSELEYFLKFYLCEKKIIIMLNHFSLNGIVTWTGTQPRLLTTVKLSVRDLSWIQAFKNEDIAEIK